MSQLLCIDLFCGLGGWTEGFLSEGYEVIGFDIENHVYGDHKYPAQLVLQDVRTLHGSQFKDAAIIVASSPCQKYSYMAMPWTKAKDLAKWYRDPLYPERLVELNELFNQPRRIQLEAIKAAGGRFIPLVQENVRGAIPWVGRSQWHYGSYHLWGNLPALMPITGRRSAMKAGVAHRPAGETNFHVWEKTGKTSPAFNGAIKNTGGSWFNIPGPGGITANNNPTRGDGIKNGGRLFPNDAADARAREEGVKQGGDWFNAASLDGDGLQSISRRSGSKSSARKMASAKIAKIPFPLSQWIARVTRESLECAA